MGGRRRLEALERLVIPEEYPPVILERSEDLPLYEGYPGVVIHGEDLLEDGDGVTTCGTEELADGERGWCIR